MRVTNEMYPRGSVIISRFPNSDRSYLTGRPMIVVSQLPLMNSLTCIECTTRDRPGIEISLYQHHLGKYNTDTEYSIACPYAIHDIPIKTVCEYLGVINPITMQAISTAMAWHLGLTTEVPPYMTQLLEEEFAPVYNMGTSANTALNIVHGFCSPVETNRKFINLQFNECPGVPYAKNVTLPGPDTPPEVRETVEYDPAQAILNWAKTALKADPASIISANELHAAYRSDTNDDMKIIGFSQRFGRIIPTLVTNAKRIKITKGPNVGKSGFIGIAFTSPTAVPPSPVADIVAQRAKLYAELSSQERFDILIHRIKAGDTYSGTKLTTEDVTWLTRRILDSHGYCNSTFTTDLVKGIENQHYHWNFIDNDKVAALMLYGDWDQIKPSAFMKLQTRFVYIIKTEHLDFHDLRKWPRIANGKDLKALTVNGGGANRTLHFPLKLILIYWKECESDKK